MMIRTFVYLNLFILSMAFWYVIAELFLTMIWSKM